MFNWQLLGIDEAGYGPRLGPLVQARAGLAWADPQPFDFDAWPAVEARVEEAAAAVQATAARLGVAVGDSKALYARGGASALWDAVGALAGHAGLAARALAPKPEPESSPWPTWLEVNAECHPAGEDDSAGLDANALDGQAKRRVGDGNARASELAQRVQRADAWAAFTAESWCLFPGAFNAWSAERNKAEINWELTRRLVRAVPALLTPTVWTLDRQGGRRYYAGRLSELFAPAFVHVVEESAARGVYRVRGPACNAWVVVKVAAESWSPATALASMVAKSLREAAMARFNAHFARRFPALKPTAGYPQDAERWRAALLELTAGTSAGAAFDWTRLWRRK